MVWDQNRAIAEGSSANSDDQIDEFISNMIVSTCGNLFRGVAVAGDYPIGYLPSDFSQGYVMDVGCNWGRWSIGGAKQGYKVVGVDPHLEALLIAKKLAERLTPDNLPLFVACDARYLPFEGGRFDGVFSYSVLQHLSRENLLRALSEIGRVMRIGAKSEIQMPNKWGIKALIDRALGRAPNDEEFNVRHYAIDDLLCCFSECIGPSEYRVDCFLGLNVHSRDPRFVPPSRRFVIDVASALETVAKAIPPFARLADSVFVRSVRSVRRDGRRPDHPALAT